jgi:hypothetical protein
LKAMLTSRSVYGLSGCCFPEITATRRKKHSKPGLCVVGLHTIC